MTQLRRFLTVQTLLIAAVALGAPAAAFAQVPPADPPPTLAPATHHSVVISQSSPLWTFVVVAVIACLVTAGAFLAGIRYRSHSPAAA